ncbi:MAG: hypothetical protein A2413_11350 [Treponema sp. RIFOXYC1_FULL_61_9]|nr:MAG: hypothetical protein A2Y36_16815 [Treponema sp. GWA1_62_8]OHE67274.1 MAG: hypothetical protein A2001_09670 [Treponema sp. GWC1_61_84]OHE75819.1 MAG: hypothetical protein A2413_11350 [Treponema sp. RIFOXYC1_FULL_61_9]
MAVRKKSSRGGNNAPGFGCLLWIALLILLTGTLLFNLERIRGIAKGAAWLKPAAPAEVSTEVPTESQPPVTAPVVGAPVAAPTTADNPAKPPAAPRTVPESKPAEKPALPHATPPAPVAVRTSPPPAASPAAPAPSAPTAKPVPKPVSQPAAQKAPDAKVETKPVTVKTAPRALWFVRIEDDGSIVRTKANRPLPVSDSPMIDALTALLAGPTAEERKKGSTSLIPAGTRLLSATVRGKTAYLSFSNEFQFNPYGIEGSAAQLRQIVWTATEFSTVSDVQFLIEGRRVDYLGSEGIWIGSPVSRDSL